MKQPGLELVLARLEAMGLRPRRQGDGWISFCPAHERPTDGHRPSLSVRLAEDGQKVLLRCFAGCSTSEILKALNLDWKDLRMDAWKDAPRASKPAKTSGVSLASTGNDDRQGSGGQQDGNGQPGQRCYPSAEAVLTSYGRRNQLGPPDHVYLYHQADGSPCFAVGRWNAIAGVREKTFCQVTRTPDGWVLGCRLEKLPPYDLPKIVKADPGQWVVIVEGEKCVEAARQCGLLATCSAGGAGAAAKTDWNSLRGRRGAILPDNDTPGQKYAETVARLALEAGAAEVKILRLADFCPTLPEGGDIADVLDSPDWCGCGLREGANPEDLGRWILDRVEKLPPWQTEPQPWPDIEPLEDVHLPTFPVDCLPCPLREWVEAEAESTQTPADLPGLLALAVCSSLLARRVEVEARPGWREPVNIYVAVLLDPGNRKSAVFREATAPLAELERLLAQQEAAEIAADQSKYRQAEARLKNLESLAAKGDSEAAHQAEALARELAGWEVPAMPRLIVEDVTEEKLGLLLAEQGGRIASISPEGGVFDVMAGRYSGTGTPQFTIYLKGHSGDSIRVDRMGRRPVHVERPAITCAYTIQPVVLSELAAKKVFRGRGLLARFLYACPPSPVGYRNTNPAPMPQEIQTAYRELVFRLHEQFSRLGSGDQPEVWRLDPEAQKLFASWAQEVEYRLRPFGDLGMMTDWGGKLVGQTLRLAAILHAVASAEEAQPSPWIPRQRIMEAIGLARYLIPHADYVLRRVLAGERPEVSGAHFLLQWIEDEHVREFTQRDCYRRFQRRFSSPEDLERALKELVDRNYIRRKECSVRGGPGRPPSPSYEVNPAIFYPKGGYFCLETKPSQSADKIDKNPQGGGVNPNFVNFVSAFEGSKILANPPEEGAPQNLIPPKSVDSLDAINAILNQVAEEADWEF